MPRNRGISKNELVSRGFRNAPVDETHGGPTDIAHNPFLLLHIMRAASGAGVNVHDCDSGVQEGSCRGKRSRHIRGALDTCGWQICNRRNCNVVLRGFGIPCVPATAAAQVQRDECEDLTHDTPATAVYFNDTNLTFVTASGTALSPTLPTPRCPHA